MASAAGGARIKLWDWPVRVVHWSFVALLPSLWWTFKQGNMALHEQLGYVMLALVLFRLYWGFAGSETARFGHFLKGPKAVAGYVSRLFGKEGEPIVGHNPVGGYSVVILLGLLALQVGLGLFAQDTDGLESGSFAKFVEYETADAARDWHELVFNVLLGFVGLHLAAILFYLGVKRDNLIGAMIHGHKRINGAVEHPTFAPTWRIALGILLSGGIAWWVSLGCPPFEA